MNTPEIFQYAHIHLVGAKGVGLTSLAQILHDAGIRLSGSDVAEHFVTQDILERLPIQWFTNFDHELPKETECVVYTAAHGAQKNPLVVQAAARNIPTLSHAEAVAQCSNARRGIAVCGVGGKSTTSSMLAWICEQLQHPVSYSVGVGEISGLTRTGVWNAASEFFIVEADEYVCDPHAAANNAQMTPRFSFLIPQVIICTNLQFDHPDVYRDFEHTQAVFYTFFSQIQTNGVLIINADDKPLVALAQAVQKAVPQKNITILLFGQSQEATLQLIPTDNVRELQFVDTRSGEKRTQSMQLPGTHNAKNALAALLASEHMGIDLSNSLSAVATFNSTKRRFEHKGHKDGIEYYDDYAHHPAEVAQSITSLEKMYPDTPVVVAFQPHTYSRTKALFDDFVTALSKAEHLVLLPIFASARESEDNSITSAMLAEAVQQKNESSHVQVVQSINDLAAYCKDLPQETVVVTLGAGDIYKVHSQV